MGSDWYLAVLLICIFSHSQHSQAMNVRKGLRLLKTFLVQAEVSSQNGCRDQTIPIQELFMMWSTVFLPIGHP